MSQGTRLPVALRDARERAIAILTESFAHDAIDLDEFDQRLTRAHGAASVAELDHIVADLPEPTQQQGTTTATALVPIAEVRDRQRVVCIFGGTERTGRWSAPRHLRIVTVFGGATIYFREARLPPGPVELHVFALMGGVEVIVPPELSVETSGSAVFGGFEHMERAPPTPEPDRPLLRITGFTMMGGVSIETRLPGESSRDARRRRKRERRALRPHRP
jgi:hypothetical protein